MSASMNKQQEFAIFVLEMYRSAKGLSGRELVDLFCRHGIWEAIESNYPIWHIERPENFIEEIDALIG
jgi:hypothetical protein